MWGTVCNIMTEVSSIDIIRVDTSSHMSDSIESNADSYINEPYAEYTEVIINQPSNIDDCVICLEPLLFENSIITTVCNHVYHKTCLNSWFDSKHYMCPICRKEIMHPPQPISVRNETIIILNTTREIQDDDDTYRESIKAWIAVCKILGVLIFIFVVLSVLFGIL